MPHGSENLDEMAARLEAMGSTTPPPDVRAMLYKLFEFERYALFAIGKLTGELSKLVNRVHLVELKMRDSRSKLESLSDDIEDSKITELKEAKKEATKLKAQREKVIWLVVASVVSCGVGMLMRHLMGP